MSTSEVPGRGQGSVFSRLDTALTSRTVKSLSDRDIQVALALVVKVYAACADDGRRFPAFLTADNVTATDVAVTATAMLGAAEIETFELGMWQIIKNSAR